MRYFKHWWALICLLTLAVSGSACAALQTTSLSRSLVSSLFLLLLGTARTAVAQILTPKVLIVSFYDDEGTYWYNLVEFTRAYNIPGLSRRFPSIYCNTNYETCEIITDEGLVNSAVSVSVVLNHPNLDLSKTYFIFCGVAGISPKVGTLGSVILSRFSVQVAQQYELDAREKPSEFPSGYIPLGTTKPGQYPTNIYGTEVFELNNDLRTRVSQFALGSALVDDATAQAYRAKYKGKPGYEAATQSPGIYACDTATSDVWWSGDLLGASAEATFKLFTNNLGVYCTTQQEDGAVFAAVLRGNLARRADFSRVISIRGASDFDRSAPGVDPADNLFNGQQAGYNISLKNVFTVARRIQLGIVNNWSEFEFGIHHSNYIGDTIGSLGGNPEFGPGSIFGGSPP